ncbi:histidine phosphatase family protein [Paracoccus ravus]|uniref:histidine phosphatase family protein n=1 Tax=Paracoccus ravus TaxID=2447760 RepID=UPI001FD71B47|nr:histidine phosphatase family protein [Paracoccus ravus]
MLARLLIARHAPKLGTGLAGRQDVGADCSDLAALGWLRDRMRTDTVWSSPALRCRQTSAAMGFQPQLVPDLWEQDFGIYEGASLPDLGPLGHAELAAYRPEGGESFLDMTARVQPVLEAARGEIAIIAHAGTVRAALALAVGPAALSFLVAPLSLTILTRYPNGWGVDCVNRKAP